jgi:hypothetical protein
MSHQPTFKPATCVHRPKKLFSKDGTAIAFDRIGGGSPVILVDGALCYRALGPSRPLAKLLAQHFTVFTYDRRGRGESGDTAPYTVEREVEAQSGCPHNPLRRRDRGRQSTRQAAAGQQVDVCHGTDAGHGRWEKP